MELQEILAASTGAVARLKIVMDMIKGPIAGVDANAPDYLGSELGGAEYTQPNKCTAIPELVK